MEPLYNTSLNPIIYFSYIGFSIATFAFLCQYLIFPKILFSDLSNMIKKSPPRIVDKKIMSGWKKNSYIKQIMCFYFEMDVIIFSALVYLLYSVLITLALIISHYHIYNHCVVDCSILLITIITSFFILLLSIKFLFIENKIDKKIKRNKIWASRIYYGVIEIILSIVLIINTIWFYFLREDLMKFFCNIIFILVLLLSWYLSSIAVRNPVRNVLAQWIDIANRKK